MGNCKDEKLVDCEILGVIYVFDRFKKVSVVPSDWPKGLISRHMIAHCYIHRSQTVTLNNLQVILFLKA